ncbi:MAG: hypothetical protein UY96_C0003G0087 [Parcubacteria group bacterium GW2011_GWB1_56_8]|nr:MAG: hypothetical protein UY96_C0003G0087 [Parcubacteria group bacterium GW2011_GWB1_56_8]
MVIYFYDAFDDAYDDDCRGLIVDLSRLRALDTETHLFRPGLAAPPVVCGSTSRVNGKIEGELFDNPTSVWTTLKAYLEAKYVIAFANASYDLLCAAQADPSLLAAIFQALREGLIHDVLTSQSLDAIYYGHLGLDPTGKELRDSKGKVSKRYSLDITTKLVLGREDAKKNDVWRKSYALLQGIPAYRWPVEAKVYPINDTDNTVEIAATQIFGKPGNHEWEEIPSVPGVVQSQTRCKFCFGELTFSWPAADEHCVKAPIVQFKNQDNLAAQVEAEFALKLGAAWSLRTDPERVTKLTAEVEKKRAVAIERFQKKGWIREDETEDQAAVKRSVAIAYSATGVCVRCGGTGKIRNVTEIDCRGEKVKGRYRGCIGDQCVVCNGRRKLDKLGNEINCKVIKTDSGDLGCDGTGFDLTTAPMLPRTDKNGIGTDRDVCMESGDDDLSDYGENEFEKSHSTFLPYLRKGLTAPLPYNPNVLLATGRCSYEGSPIHQFPRAGGERKCIRARGAWCGSSIEYVLGSTDYSAGELCALAQYTYWAFDYSQMRDAINASGDPGILHSELAAEVLGLPLDEFLKRLKAKDKQAVDFRQASKPLNFGKPAMMGPPKIVYTNRKKNAGFTVCEGGPAENAKGEPGYWGIRFCILVGGEKRCGIEKIMKWKGFDCIPVCKKCVEIEANVLSPAYFRRFPEIKDYHNWGKSMIKQKRPAPSVVWDAKEGMPRIIRERGFLKWDEEISAMLNNGFQSMLADIGKHAYVTATRECYLGVKDDGLASPLAGCRLPAFMHDEPLSELILSTAYLSGPRIAEIMMASGKLIAPDVVWKAETALGFWWDKSMEPVYNERKELVPWGPIPVEHQAQFGKAA